MGHARHALSQIFSAKKALHKNIANFNRTLSRQNLQTRHYFYK